MLVAANRELAGREPAGSTKIRIALSREHDARPLRIVGARADAHAAQAGGDELVGERLRLRRQQAGQDQRARPAP